MNRRVLFRVLLSLVLLVSQQMAIAHAISHWSVATSGERASAEEQNALSRAVAEDRSCAQCLAFAQVGGAVPHFGPVFVPAADLRFALARETPAAALPGAVLFYHSRGPPAAA